MLQRKTFFYIFSTIFLCIILGVCFFSISLSANGNTHCIPEHITLTWSGNSQITQTIIWKTEATTVAGQVEYVEAAAAKKFPDDAETASAEVKDLFTNLGNMSIHSATLSNLKSGTRYFYRVGDGISWSSSHTFITSPVNPPKFKFLIFGDSQSVNYNTWSTTLHKAYQMNPDAAFMINMGDLVDVGQDYAQWDAWFSAAKGVIDTIPIMPVSGNHEDYTLERKFSMPVFFTNQFKLPDKGPDGLRGQVYSFDYGDVHFSVLDSQSGEEKQFVPSILELQREWLENDLKSSNKKWKIVLVHRPPYNNKENNDNRNIHDTFVPLFDKYHVNIVFTAHEHVYARTYPLYGDEVVGSPEKGTIYIATGRSGTKTYQNTVAKDWDEFFYNPLDEPNYLIVEVVGESLTVKAFKQQGTLIDAWTVTSH